MPRYFFNFDSTEPVTDNEGAVLEDDEAACKEATKAAGEMLRDVDGHCHLGGKWTLRVTDENRNPIYTINISAQKTS